MKGMLGDKGQNEELVCGIKESAVALNPAYIKL